MYVMCLCSCMYVCVQTSKSEYAACTMQHTACSMQHGTHAEVGGQPGYCSLLFPFRQSLFCLHQCRPGWLASELPSRSHITHRSMLQHPGSHSLLGIHTQILTLALHTLSHLHGPVQDLCFFQISNLQLAASTDTEPQA